jgi:hypothetical protein
MTVQMTAEIIDFEQHYRTPQSTIDAFWHVVRNYDEAYIRAWLDRHPRDCAFLLEDMGRRYAK